MRYTIEGFSQTEAIKFRRTETIKRKNPRTGVYEDKETVVALDCTDLVILRWLVDFWPRMIKVEIGGVQYAWLSYKDAIKDMPLLGVKKAAFALRLKKMVSFGILTHKTVKSNGTFSYYGFGPEYMRLADTDRAREIYEGEQNSVEGVHKILDTPTQNFSDQIDSSTKDSSTRKPNICHPTIEEVKAYVREKGYHFDPQHFFDYYEASGWRMRNGKPVKNWKLCCVTWERNASSDAKPRQETIEAFAEYDLTRKQPRRHVQTQMGEYDDVDF